MSNLPIRLFEANNMAVRTTIKDGDVWFVAKDICDVVGVSKHRDAAAKLEDFERSSAIVDTLGGRQEMTIVNESGMYSLVFRSRKPEAKAFRIWVTNDVLPNLRKNGGYLLGNTEEEIAANAIRTYQWTVERQKTKDGYTIMTDAVRDHALEDGRVADSLEYATEANLINLIVLHNTSRKWREEKGINKSELIRDKMEFHFLKEIAELQKSNAMLIQMGVSFDDRRVMLQDYFNKQIKTH